MANVTFKFNELHIVQVPCFCDECGYAIDVSYKENGTEWYCNKIKKYVNPTDYCSRGKKNKTLDN